jgi:hypothetical protein
MDANATCPVARPGTGTIRTKPPFTSESCYRKRATPTGPGSPISRPWIAAAAGRHERRGGFSVTSRHRDIEVATARASAERWQDTIGQEELRVFCARLSLQLT